MDSDHASSASSARPAASGSWSRAYIAQIMKNPPLDEAAIDRFLEPVRAGRYPDWNKLTVEQVFYVRMTRGDETDPDAYTQPPRKYWDPEDSSTWKQFGDECDFSYRQTKFLLSPSNPSIIPDLKISSTFAFELYFIEIIKIDPQAEFKFITMSCRATNYTPLLIYKRPNGQEIRPYTPLPLKGPIRPTAAGDGNGVIFQIFELMDFYYQDHPCAAVKPDFDVPVVNLVKHTRTESAVNLCYEFITSAAKAHLVFCFLGDEFPIHIIYGMIFATNGEDMRTKRIIKSFSSEDPPVLISDDKELKVDRFVFGVPTTSTLTVSVELMYYTQKGYKCTIHGSHTFSVPEFWLPEEHLFTGTDGTRLGLTVHWSNV